MADKPDLGLLEEDDEFEEFPAEGEQNSAVDLTGFGINFFKQIQILKLTHRGQENDSNLSRSRS